MAQQIVTPWLAPTVATTPAYNSYPTVWTNKDAALTQDASDAVASGSSFSAHIYLQVPSKAGAGHVVALSASGAIQTDSFATINGQPLDYADVTQLFVEASIHIGVGSSFNNSRLQMKGFDFSAIPAGSTIYLIEQRVYYKLTSTAFSVDYAELRVTYSPPTQTVTATPIDSLEAFGTPVANIVALISTVSSTDSAESFGVGLLTMNSSSAGAIATAEALSTNAVAVQTPPPPPPPTDWSAIGKEDEKVFVYKVYSSSGAYLGVWSDVKDDLMFTQQINSPGTTTTVQLARSANTLREVRDVLVDQAGAVVTDQAGQAIYGVYNTTNAIGPGTDVQLNHRVDVYVHYGGFEPLLDQLGAVVTDQANDPILVPYGAPLGRRVFSGFILDYESDYAAEDGVTVTLSSHGFELSHELVRDGETVVVTKTSTEIGLQIKQILDTNPQTLSYSTASIDNTGISPTTKFQLNTKYEAIKSLFDQVPGGWYWYGNVAENLVYLKQRSSTADHTFLKGLNIKELRVKYSMEGLKNRVYFLGGEMTPGTPSSVLFKKTDDAASQATWRVGLDRRTDRRYTVPANAQRYMDQIIARYKNPIFTSPIVISAARYDIESIKLGQTVDFGNFDNYIDDLPPQQIVSFSYTPYAVMLQLGELQESQSEIITEVQDDLSNDQYETIPNAPS